MFVSHVRITIHMCIIHARTLRLVLQCIIILNCRQENYPSYLDNDDDDDDDNDNNNNVRLLCVYYTVRMIASLLYASILPTLHVFLRHRQKTIHLVAASSPGAHDIRSMKQRTG